MSITHSQPGHSAVVGSASAAAVAPAPLADYANVHQDRTNLAVHAVAVPVFLAGTVATVAGAVTLAWPIALAGAVAMLVSIGFQGFTHKREPVPFEPFEGPRDAIVSILVEQWITFPRFVASGGFARAWRARR